MHLDHNVLDFGPRFVRQRGACQYRFIVKFFEFIIGREVERIGVIGQKLRCDGPTEPDLLELDRTPISRAVLDKCRNVDSSSVSPDPWARLEALVSAVIA